MKKTKSLVLTIILTLTIFFGVTGCQDDGKTKIGIVQIVEHASLDLIKDAIIDKLDELGYNDDNSIIYTKSAAGDSIIANQIISEFKSQNCDIIIPIATPTAQAALSVAKEIPVVFAAVSDPIGAGLTTSLTDPDKGITGTSDEIQVDQIINLALQINPNLKTLGVIYNPSESNSVTNINNVKTYCEELNINVMEVSISNATDIATNITAFDSKVDAIFTPNDNTVATEAGMNSLANFCNAKKIPLYVGADSMVESGGFATIGINYVELGHETAIMADKVLKGTPINEIEIKVFNNNLKIYVNKNVLNTISITLPISIINNDNFILIGE